MFNVEVDEKVLSYGSVAIGFLTVEDAVSFIETAEFFEAVKVQVVDANNGEVMWSRHIE